MADPVSGPVGTEQNVVEDGVFSMSTVGAMNTNERDTIVTEVSHVPSDKFVYLVASQTGNELSFVQSQPMTSRIDSRLSPRLAGPHSSDHVSRSSHVGAFSGSTWRMNTSNVERPIYRATLEMEVAETKQMLCQQQTVLSSLSETLKSIQSEMGKRNDSAPDIEETTNQVRPTSGSSPGVEVNKAKTKVSRKRGKFLSFFTQDTDTNSSESEEESEDNDDADEPPQKQAKTEGASDESRSTDGNSKLSKLDKLFCDKLDQGPRVNENLANAVNKGISNTFSIKSVLEFAENYKQPENCEFLRVPKLNEELYFEDSIASRFKKNDSVLQKTQLLLTKGMTPLVKLMDKLLANEEGDGEIFDLATDSLQLLAYTHRDISYVRRKFLKPAVAKKYKRLCSANIPLTANLLGDELDKQLKSINEHKKIGAQMTNESSRKRHYVRDNQQPSTSQKSDYGSRNTSSSHSQSFLYQSKGNNPRYKKGKGSYQNSNNNNNKRSK